MHGVRNLHLAACLQLGSAHRCQYLLCMAATYFTEIINTSPPAYSLPSNLVTPTCNVQYVTVIHLTYCLPSIYWSACNAWCSFTLEASFAGPDTGAFAGSHYDTSQLESIGANLALALLDYSDPDQAAQAAADMKRAVQRVQQQPAPVVQGLQCDAESSGSMTDGTAAVSRADVPMHVSSLP